MTQIISRPQNGETLRQRIAAVVTLLGGLILLSGCGGSFVESDLGLPLHYCGGPSQDAAAWRPGCATHRNMAAIAAAPDDLIRARAEAPRDATRRDAVLAAYGRKRSGREQAEPVAVSAAGEKGDGQ